MAAGIVGCKQEYPQFKPPAAGEEQARTAGGAVAPAEAPEVEQAPEPRPDPVDLMTADWHPAARERPYKLLRAAEVPADEAEQEFLTRMMRAREAEKAFRVIKKERDRRLPFLRRAVRHPNREVRIQAIIMLGLLKDDSPETEEVLCDAILLDRDPDVRASAAKDFIVLKSPKAVETLIQSLAEDPYEAARANAAWALGSVRDRRAVDPLREATRDEDTMVRLRAVSALLKMKPKQAVPELIDRLEDSSPMVRERALEALRAITRRNLGKEAARWRKAYPQ
jgi:HEAT repeat protein